ncbi:MAG: D-lactate dehydrogenase [Actinomycetota bacterium]|nr:D-lactate dehydrogenase [Actinomycetota bacterium]
MSLTDISSRSDLGSVDTKSLGELLRSALPRDGAVTTAAFDRVTAAVDASHYLLTPSAVVTPSSAEEIAKLFAYATGGGERLTFRSGGTSLSGQASTDHILVDTRKNFRRITVLDDGLRVRVQPGATVRQVNARLLRFGRKLGPDPASEIACTIGGVIANNSSGMACGITQNTYRTLESAVIVLPSGTIVDSSESDSDEKLRATEPRLWTALGDLRDRVRASPAMRDEVVRQYQIKNTMGYGLNSLVDHDSPVEILTHLLVGSEGTLGFIAEATFATVPLLRKVATAFLVFDTLHEATDALTDIITTSPATIELLDAASLRVVQQDPTSIGSLPELEFVNHAALLVEYQAATDDELAPLVEGAEALFARMVTSTPSVLTSDPVIRAALWHLRKGLYAAIAGARPSGTTALLEDIAVPVAQLSETCAALQRLFAIHGYDDAVIFGHAKDGNIHFLLNENFEDATHVARYRAFTEDMVDVVLGAGGSLKAEHGTGRIMAPFVQRQFGTELHGIMLAIKSAFDPAGILNPDAVLTADPELHLRHLKSTPTVEEEVDRCVECGYCEPVCPSKDLTTTPRQRIVVRRAIAAAQQVGDTALVRELSEAQEYDVVDTCAVDGMCQTACPVFINTGDLVRRLRGESVGAVANAGWKAAGKAWQPLTEVASVALTIASVVPPAVLQGPNKLARRVLGEDTVPMWSPDLPKGGARREKASKTVPEHAEIVYFQACVGTMFGTSAGSAGVAASFESLARKADVEIVRPSGIGSLCCGTPWKSKGMVDGYHEMVDKTVDSLWEASRHGELPIVCDNSSCSEGLVHALEDAVARRPREYSAMRIVDAVDFAAERILPRIVVDAELETLALHPTCSSTRAGSNQNLSLLAGAVASSVTIPDDWGCCAFAGDRGMLHPELTASATHGEADNLAGQTFDAYASCNRTCEIGMTRATGHDYQHILELLDGASRRSPDATPLQ